MLLAACLKNMTIGQNIINSLMHFTVFCRLPSSRMGSGVAVVCAVKIVNLTRFTYNIAVAPVALGILRLISFFLSYLLLSHHDFKFQSFIKILLGIWPLNSLPFLKMKICGPKLSLCGLIISAWGIIQLALMGLFFHMRSVALAEDLPGHEEHFATKEAFYSAADKGYTLNAYNCWIAAVLYFLTLLLSAQQFYANTKSSVSL